MLEFQIPFVKSRVSIKRVFKSVTRPGQAVPMSVLVQKFVSGQVVGISSFSAYFDDSVDEFNFDSSYFPDPANPLAYEQAILDANQFNHEYKKRYNAAKSSASKPDQHGNDQDASEAAAAT